MSVFPFVWPYDFIWVCLFGVCLGSFATAVTYRELHDLGWLLPPKQKQSMDVYCSACPQCHHRLGFWDLWPIVSWVLLRGRCRYCRAPIGWLYPMIEIFVLLACLFLYLLQGLTTSSLVAMLAVPFLVALIVVDFQRMILPNLLVLIVAVLGGVWLAVQWGTGELSSFAVLLHLGAAVLYGAFFWGLGALVAFLLKKEALGGGDVKFVAAAGLWLGPALLSPFCIVAGFLGVVIGAAWRAATKSAVFPFGPALIVTFYLFIVLGTAQVERIFLQSFL